MAKVNTPSWKSEAGQRRQEKKQRRQKARDRAISFQRKEDQQLRSSYMGRGKDDKPMSANESRYAHQQYQQAQKELNEQRYQERKAASAERDRREYERTRNRDIGQMIQLAKRREQDADFIRRAEAGEVEFEGDLSDIKTGKAWDQGQINAYEDYTSNQNYYKKNPDSFDYRQYGIGRAADRAYRRKPTAQRRSGLESDYGSADEQYTESSYSPQSNKPSPGNSLKDLPADMKPSGGIFGII